MLFILKTIQTEITVLSSSISIYNKMLQEIFLKALREELYDLIIFQIQNEVIELSVQNTLHLLKKKKMKQTLNNSAKNITVDLINVSCTEGQHCNKRDKDKAEKICYWCQQQSHFVSDCFTKTNKNSKELLSKEDFKSTLKFETITKVVSENSEKLKNLKNLKNSDSHNCNVSEDSRAWRTMTMKVKNSLKLLSES